MSFDTTIIAQDYVNVFELFDVARAAATVERLGYTTWLHGTVRTLQTHRGPHAAQLIQRYDASGRPYPVDDDQPHGWALVSLTTDDDDWRVDDTIGFWTNSATGWPRKVSAGAGSTPTMCGSSATPHCSANPQRPAAARASLVVRGRPPDAPATPG